MILKRSLIILILTAFLFNQMGYYPYFLAIQYQIKNQVKRQISQNPEKHKLINISFDESKDEQPHWVHQGKEIIFGGQYYDVVNLEIRGTVKIFRCISDKKETHLVNLLNGITKNRLRNLRNIFLNYLFQINILTNDNQYFCSVTSKPIKLFIKNSSLHSRFNEFDPPPPKA